MFTPSIEDSPQVSNVLMIKDKKRSLSERIGKKKPRIVPENTRISEEEEIFKVPKKEEEEVPTDPSSEQVCVHESKCILLERVLQYPWFTTLFESDPSHTSTRVHHAYTNDDMGWCSQYTSNLRSHEWSWQAKVRLVDKEERIQYPTEERERRDCGSIVEEDESNARIDIEADQANNPSSVWDLCMIDYPIELHSSLLDTSNSSKCPRIEIAVSSSTREVHCWINPTSLHSSVKHHPKPMATSLLFVHPKWRNRLRLPPSKRRIHNQHQGSPMVFYNVILCVCVWKQSVLLIKNYYLMFFLLLRMLIQLGYFNHFLIQIQCLLYTNHRSMIEHTNRWITNVGSEKIGQKLEIINVGCKIRLESPSKNTIKYTNNHQAYQNNKFRSC